GHDRQRDQVDDLVAADEALFENVNDFASQAGERLMFRHWASPGASPPTRRIRAAVRPPAARLVWAGGRTARRRATLAPRARRSRAASAAAPPHLIVRPTSAIFAKCLPPEWSTHRTDRVPAPGDAREPDSAALDRQRGAPQPSAASRQAAPPASLPHRAGRG